MATVNSIALEMIQRVEESTDDTGFVSLVETEINNALDEIATATNWNHFKTRTTINTVIAQADYQLPIGGRAINQLRYPDTGEPITMWTTQEATRRRFKLENSGRPLFWIEDGNIVDSGNVLYQFRLSPVPDSVLAIECEYYYHPSQVASADPLPVQDQYIVLVKKYVEAFLDKRDQRYDAAAIALGQYQASLGRLVAQEKRKPAAMTQLKATDLTHIQRKPHAQFDPSHFENP